MTGLWLVNRKNERRLTAQSGSPLNVFKTTLHAGHVTVQRRKKPTDILEDAMGLGLN